jgi:hypothetical protein
MLQYSRFNSSTAESNLGGEEGDSARVPMVGKKNQTTKQLGYTKLS